MAEKLQSKVKLRSGEVVTVDHVKPSKTASSTTKSTKTPTPKTTEPVQDAPDATTPPAGDETQTPSNEKTNQAPKETK